MQVQRKNVNVGIRIFGNSQVSINTKYAMLCVQLAFNSLKKLLTQVMLSKNLLLAAQSMVMPDQRVRSGWHDASQQPILIRLQPLLFVELCVAFGEQHSLATTTATARQLLIKTELFISTSSSLHIIPNNGLILWLLLPSVA